MKETKAAATVRQFVVRLLSRRKRRLPILYRWNLYSPPCEGKTLEEVVHAFMRVLLYAPLQLCVSHDALFPWGVDHPGLAIPFHWLTQRERNMIRLLHVHRAQLFYKDSRVRGQPGHFLLSGYMHSLELSGQHRRELLRDFVALCWVQKREEDREALYYAILLAVQRLIHREEVVDPFLVPLSRLLNGLCGPDNLLVIN